jgi:UDP-2,3-diacylglucosamine pyrophosphatase LpxH
MANKVFVSYARDDLSRVLTLVEFLRKQGCSVFWDQDLPAGSSHRERIAGELEEAKHVIVIWSRWSVESDFVLAEAQAAQEAGKLLPLLFDDVVIPLGFRGKQTGSLVGWQGEEHHPELQKLLIALRVPGAHVESAAAAAEPLPEANLLQEGKTVLVFRFRDLLADTLGEHRKIIAQHPQRGCWWGWWKRPSESSRCAAWQALKTATSAAPVSILLFDSGTGRVTRARVAEVIEPSDAGPVRPPAEELELIPEYYRASPYSQAWLRLIGIDDKPLEDAEFFRRYAFSEPPPLPGIGRENLKRLRGKRILDAFEMRAMDTTIWEVEFASSSGSDQATADGAERPTAPGQHPLARALASVEQEERFVAPSLGLRDPVSQEAVRLKSNLILHLSDLHFDRRGPAAGTHIWARSGSETLARAVKEALGENRVGALVITGDFTMIAHEEEFEAAYRDITALLRSLELSPNEVVICPGNHDIAWTKKADEVYQEQAEFFAAEAPAAASAAYAKFYSELLKHAPNADFSMGRRWLLPNGCVLEICGLNSSSFEHGKKYLTGMGKLTPGAFVNAANRLGWRPEAPTLALRVVAIHHHVTLTENTEKLAEYYQGFGMLADAKKLLREAAPRGVQLVLHGHRHRTFLWREGVYGLPEFAQKSRFLGHIAVLGGGSAGSTDTDGERNFFNLLSLEPSALEVMCYKSEHGGPFEQVAKWQAELDLAKGGLRLAEWS